MAQICRAYEKKYGLNIGSLKERTLRGFGDALIIHLLVITFSNRFAFAPVTSEQGINQWLLCVVEVKLQSCPSGWRST